METGTDSPRYGYAIYKEGKPGEGEEFVLWIGYQYAEAYAFVEPVGLARVKVGDKKDGKYGFISTSNAMLIRPRFEAADNFNQKGFCRVVLDGKWGLIDCNGNFTVPNKYDSMDDLFNGWYEVSQGDVWGYVYRTGVYASTREEYQQKCEAGLVDEQ